MGTTTTTMGSGRRKRAAGSKEEFLGVIHDITHGAKVWVDGVEMEEGYLNKIMPSKVQRDYSYDDLEADLVMNAEAPNLQSGSISWSEAAVINNDHLREVEDVAEPTTSIWNQSMTEPGSFFLSTKWFNLTSLLLPLKQQLQPPPSHSVYSLQPVLPLASPLPSHNAENDALIICVPRISST